MMMALSAAADTDADDAAALERMAATVVAHRGLAGRLVQLLRELGRVRRGQVGG
jgi:hypothetical protein